ncbi:DNA-binding domain-containing protein [Ectobacillus sp. sgz5001026]|uniref:DNA-binding domain-containing protein n=1 Tax=Ectobacillus sp. sgz5001026 TaxID=3242473 RepID=UPI0036D4203C
MHNKSRIIEEITVTLEKLIESNDSAEIKRMHMQELSQSLQVEFEDIITLYNKMELFQQEVSELGGMDTYQKSKYSWLKAELDLLLFIYQFFQKNGISVITISDLLSIKHLNIFPKTKNQLQNTYYKLRNNQLPLENIIKQKPGRKPGQEYKKIASDLNESNMKKKQDLSENTEIISQQPKYSLVHLLSGMVRNFQTICDDNENEKRVYQLMAGIYELSGMAADGINVNKNGSDEQMLLLRQETERLKREQKEIMHEIRGITNHIKAFVESTDVDQIKNLSGFVNECKRDLNRLEVYNVQKHSTM